MKNDIADILFKYTTGEATLEETNDALKEAEAGFNLEPGRNEITPDEMALTTVGDTPEEANGFGLLDTGTGSMEKVHVTNGKLDEAINQVNHDGTTNMLAFVIIGPNRYEVKGDTLTDCYRETGKESMKMLTQGEVNTVARVLQNMKDSVSRSVRDKRTDTGGDIRTTAQRRKIYALCEALGWNDDPRRIQGFVKRVAHVDRIEWLNMAQCEKVIEGLKAILARQRRKEAEL